MLSISIGSNELATEELMGAGEVVGVAERGA